MSMKKLAIFLVIISVVLLGCEQKKYIHVGENWAAVNAMNPDDGDFPVEVSQVKSNYQLGKEFHFEVKSSRTGRLWVAQIDADDEMSVVYPNDYVASNEIVAGESVYVPGIDEEWSLVASDPIGSTVMVFIVTKGDLELTDILQDENGISKALSIVQETDQWGFDKKIFEVTE